MDRQKLDIELDMLKGNINRMCVTDSRDELMMMYAWANKRLNSIMAMNEERLKEVSKMKMFDKAARHISGKEQGE